MNFSFMSASESNFLFILACYELILINKIVWSTNIQKSNGKKNEEIRILTKKEEKYCKIMQGVGCREKTCKRFLFFRK